VQRLEDESDAAAAPSVGACVAERINSHRISPVDAPTAIGIGPADVGPKCIGSRRF
jgi:hypothetical protein